MTTLNSLNPVTLSGGFGAGDASSSSGTAEKSPGLIGRMTGWLRRNPSKNDQPQADEAERSAEALLELADGMAARDLPGAEASSDLSDSDDRDADEDTGGSEDALLPAAQPSNGRPAGIFRRWGRREANVERIQEGLGALTQLMRGIHDHMERQSARQDELVRYLSHLPQALEQLPLSLKDQAESLRQQVAAQGEAMQRQAEVQVETLRAIQTQAERQGRQQDHVGALLERLTEADARTGRTLEAVETRLAVVGRHDAAVSESMESVARSSRASTEVLEQLHEHLRSRDLGFERVVERQGTRFTSILAVATLLAVAALTGVGILGYLFVNRAHF
jgi:hypothetical protein